MCDYSLHSAKQRPARVGDKLTVSKFLNTITKGLREHGGDLNTAVCMLPGTEVAFASEPKREPAFGVGVLPNQTIASKLARFRQINLEIPTTHHDALEFANGETVLISKLVDDQQLTVLQLGREEAKAETEQTQPEQPTIREGLVQRFAEIGLPPVQRINDGSLTSTAEPVS